MHRSEIPIVKPCSLAADWSSLPGDERKRFCGQCDRHVYDLSAMSEEEARALVTTQHVCVRYVVDASGRILHGIRWSTLAMGAALASAAHAAPAIEPEDQGWLSWLTERAWAWWSPPPAPPAPPLVLPPVAPPVVPPIRPPIQPHPAAPKPAPYRDAILEPIRPLGGVPLPPPPPREVRVEDLTSRSHVWLESSCCGRARFVNGEASIVVDDPGYIELVGDPSTRIRVRPGDEVVCRDFEGAPRCRVMDR